MKIQTARTRAARAAACLAVLTSLLTACGGGSDQVETSQESDTESSATAPGASELAGPPVSAPSESNGLTSDVPPLPSSETTSLYDDVENWFSKTLNPPVEPMVGPNPAVQGKQSLASYEASKSTAMPADAGVKGVWTEPQSWPLIAIHASLLPDGRVMTYGTNRDGKQTGKFIYDLWDSSSPRQDTGHLTLPNVTKTDLFCSAQVLLPSTGELFLAGGDNWNGNTGRTTNTGNNNTVLFDPLSNSMRSGNNINRARWYGTVTTLSDSQIFIMGGAGGADISEVRAKDGTFKTLPDAVTGEIDYWYPRNFLTRDDRIFGLDSRGRMFYVDPRDRGYVQRHSYLNQDLVGNGSSAVMYSPGQILQIGASTNRAVRMGIDYPLPKVTETARLSSARFWGSTTVLPDGKVLVTGGSAQDNRLVGVNNTAELWDPQTERWTLGAAGKLARLYHSTALLLPDATVLVAGGGSPGPLLNTNAERYWPPYLFGPDGQPASRPHITSAPDRMTPGSVVSIGIDSASTISKAVLIRTGSVTHSFGFDQRRIQLDHNQQGNLLQAHIPANGAIVPPGYYMLFVLNAEGVPSAAKIIQVEEGARKAIHADWIGTLGGNGGRDYSLECASDEVLAGIYGNAGWYVDRVGPRCVRTDAVGNWIGEPYSGPSAGGTGGGAFTRTCPRNQAVVGLAGRTGGYADNLQISCEPLTGSSRASGSITALPTVGGTGGFPRPYRRCGAEGVARGIYGRNGGLIDAFGLLCRSEDTEGAHPFHATSKTQMHGGTTGQPAFDLSCQSDEVLAGVKGWSGSTLNKVAPLCVKVNEYGQWTSDVLGRGAAGSKEGSEFTRLCPANQAVSGYSARTEGRVNQITLQCQPLASSGRLKSGATTLEAAGGASGTVHGDTCSSAFPAHGIFGRGGSGIDAIGLTCRGNTSS